MSHLVTPEFCRIRTRGSDSRRCEVDSAECPTTCSFARGMLRLSRCAPSSWGRCCSSGSVSVAAPTPSSAGPSQAEPTARLTDCSVALDGAAVPPRALGHGSRRPSWRPARSMDGVHRHCRMHARSEDLLRELRRGDAGGRHRRQSRPTLSHVYRWLCPGACPCPAGIRLRATYRIHRGGVSRRQCQTVDIRNDSLTACSSARTTAACAGDCPAAKAVAPRTARGWSRSTPRTSLGASVATRRRRAPIACPQPTRLAGSSAAKRGAASRAESSRRSQTGSVTARVG